MKRIALQYSGEIRNLFDCFNNHYETFILANPDYEIDIFAHFWVDQFESEERRSKVRDTIKAKVLVFEERINFDNADIVPDPRFPHPIQNTFSMFYSMEKVNDIRIKYEKTNSVSYDYVIRLRSDTLFSSPIGSISNYEKDHVHAWHGFYHLEYGIPDHFAIGTPKLMNKFLSVYSNLDKIIKDGAAINPECLLGFNAVRYHNIPMKFHNWKFYKWQHVLWILNN